MPVRLQLAEDQAEQVVLPAPLGPIRPILSPRWMRLRKFAQQSWRSHRKDLLTCSSSATSLPLLSPASSCRLTFAHPLAAPGVRHATVEPLHAEYRAASAGLDALANPDLLLLQQLVGAGVGQRLPRAAWPSLRC